MTQSFSTAIAAIYDAALSEQHWQPALWMLSQEAGSLGAILFATDHVGLPFEIEQSSFPMEHVRYYFDHLGRWDREVMNGPAKRHPPLRYLRDVDVWGDTENLMLRPDYAWLNEKIGARRRAMIRLSDEPGWTDLLGLNFSTGWDERSAVADERLGRLLPHLAKVVGINRKFSMLRRRYKAVLAALDHIRIGTCVTTASGEIVIANTEARRIFDLADGVSLTASQRLQIYKEHEAAALEAAIRAVATTATGDDGEREALVLAPRKSGAQPFVIEVAPVRDRNGEVDTGFHGALVFIVDPENLAAIQVTKMCALFSLTAAEGEVCQWMFEGLSAAEVAERRGVAEGTVKAQFRSIYAKTGVHRRVDLIRLALTVDPPVI